MRPFFLAPQRATRGVINVPADGLREIPSVGDAPAATLTPMHRTGSHPKLEEMRKELPAGMLGMLAVHQQRNRSETHAAVDANAMFSAMRAVRRVTVQFGKPFELPGRLSAELFPVPGKESEAMEAEAQ